MIGAVCGSDVFVYLQNAYQFVTLRHVTWNVVTHLLSEDIKGYFILNVFINAALGLPRWLDLHLQIFHSICRTMNPFSDLSHTCCCSCCSLYHCCCFNFLFLLFLSFLSNLPVDVWAWSLIMASEYIFFYTKSSCQWK